MIRRVAATASTAASDRRTREPCRATATTSSWLSGPTSTTTSAGRAGAGRRLMAPITAAGQGGHQPATPGAVRHPRQPAPRGSTSGAWAGLPGSTFVLHRPGEEQAVPVHELLLIGGMVAVGALLQRVAGMGMGMVAAPLLTLLLGPVTGVTTSNAAAVVVAVLVLSALHRDVDWGRVLRLAPLIVVGSALGALAVRSAPTAWLDVLVGGSVLLALATSAA